MEVRHQSSWKTSLLSLSVGQQWTSWGLKSFKSCPWRGGTILQVGGGFWLSEAGKRDGKVRRERWFGERKAPKNAQVLLAPLLYPTITQRPLDHLWDVLVRTEIPQVLLWLDPKSRKSGRGQYKDVPCFCCLRSVFKSGAPVNPNVCNCHCRSLTLAAPPPPTKHLCLAPSIVVSPPPSNPSFPWSSKSSS